jgi:hypothetical protein
MKAWVTLSLYRPPGARKKPSVPASTSAWDDTMRLVKIDTSAIQSPWAARSASAQAGHLGMCEGTAYAR